MKELYRYGSVDDCTGHWSTLYQCLKLRTKFAHQVEPKCVMRLRTPLGARMLCLF